jgi:hypothetical protein
VLQLAGTQILGENAPIFVFLLSNREVGEAAKKQNLDCPSQPHLQAILKKQILGIFNTSILTKCANGIFSLQLYKLHR